VRQLIVTEFVSLDGVIEDPSWTFPYWNDEVNAFKEAEDALTDTLLLGRVTYEGFAAAWPESDDPGAPRMNSMPKYVVSSTLETADWNNTTIIRENPVEAFGDSSKIVATAAPHGCLSGAPNTPLHTPSTQLFRFTRVSIYANPR